MNYASEKLEDPDSLQRMNEFSSSDEGRTNRNGFAIGIGNDDSVRARKRHHSYRAHVHEGDRSRFSADGDVGAILESAAALFEHCAGSRGRASGTDRSES